MNWPEKEVSPRGLSSQTLWAESLPLKVTATYLYLAHIHLSS